MILETRPWILRKLTSPSKVLMSFLTYLATYEAIRLFFVSLLTYFLISPSTHLADLSDTLSSNELAIACFTAFAYVFFQILLYPLIQTSRHQVITVKKIYPDYFKSQIEGAFLMVGFCAAMTVIGSYRYLGFFIHFENTSMAFLNLILRISVLTVMIYCEEYFFREQLFNKIREFSSATSRLKDWAPILTTSVFYVVMKWIQFDLGIMHVFTLFLISIKLGMLRSEQGNFARGAGYLTGALLVTHVLLGLPILGIDFPGLILLKYIDSDTPSRYDVFLTGGLGGPLSSFLFQMFLSATIIWQAVTKKTIIKG